MQNPDYWRGFNAGRQKANSAIILNDLSIIFSQIAIELKQSHGWDLDTIADLINNVNARFPTLFEDRTIEQVLAEAEEIVGCKFIVSEADYRSAEEYREALKEVNQDNA